MQGKYGNRSEVGYSFADHPKVQMKEALNRSTFAKVITERPGGCFMACSVHVLLITDILELNLRKNNA